MLRRLTIRLTPVSTLFTSMRRQDHISTLAANPRDAQAWNALGDSLAAHQNAILDDVQYTKRDCFLQVLRLDDRNVFAWTELGRCLDEDSVRVHSHDGMWYSQRDCLAEALSLDPRCKAAWIALADCLTFGDEDTAGVNGYQHTNIDCFAEALALYPGDADVWVNLAAALSEEEQGTALVEGKVYTARDCLIEALRLDPKHVAAWSELGHSLSDGEAVAVNEKTPCSRSDCYAAAVQIAPENATAWTNLGISLATGEGTSFMINDVEYTSRSCWVEALKWDKCDAEAWTRLSNDLSAKETVVVNGTQYTKAQCVANGFG